ncbi:MAG: DUF167 domain-containing protein [Rhodospirillaceae bacterium]
MSFFRRAEDGLIVSVRVTPKASRTAVQGTMPTPDGLALKVAVTAPADKGKANAAVAALLAGAFGIAKSSVALTAGETGRRKVFKLTGDADALARVAQQWMSS